MESKYSDLVTDATAHFRTLKARGIIDNDPFEGTQPNQQPSKPEHTDPKSNNNPKPSEDAVVPPAIIPPTAITPTTNPPEPEAAPSATDEPPAEPDQSHPPKHRTAPRAQPHEEIETVAITDSQQSTIKQLAETYTAIFAAHGFTPPSDTEESTARNDNSGGIRTQLAKRIGLSGGSIPELRPFSLKPLKEETMRALVSKAPNVIEMKALTEKYNELVEAIREQLAQSDAGQALAESLADFKHTLERTKGLSFDKIRHIDSITGIHKTNFDDYFEAGGTHMRHAASIEDVLEEVNKHWKAREVGHNILKHDEHTWKPETRNYIDAHNRVRSEYESLARAFESTMTTQVEGVRHNEALREQAKEFALLELKYELQEKHPRDRDLRLNDEEARKYREYHARLRSEPQFAAAVATARDIQIFADKETGRKTSIGTGTAGGNH